MSPHRSMRNLDNCLRWLIENDLAYWVCYYRSKNRRIPVNSTMKWAAEQFCSSTKTNLLRIKSFFELHEGFLIEKSVGQRIHRVFFNQNNYYLEMFLKECKFIYFSISSFRLHRPGSCSATDSNRANILVYFMIFWLFWPHVYLWATLHSHLFYSNLR